MSRKYYLQRRPKYQLLTLNIHFCGDFEIRTEMSRLNEDYSDSGLTFSLVNTTRTVNPEWFNGVQPGSPLQDDMKKQLRQGDANALNIYTVSFGSVEDDEGILLGYSTFPANYTNNPTDDGVVIRHNVLPGESGAEFGSSKVNIHIYPRSLTPAYIDHVKLDAYPRDRTLGWTLSHLPRRVRWHWRPNRRHSRRRQAFRWLP